MMQPYIPFDLAPMGNQSFDATDDKPFIWSFRDPSVNHTQGGYYIEYKENKSGSKLNKTGWITSSSSQHIFPVNTFLNNKNYAWRVKVRDNTLGTNLLSENQSTFEYSTDGWLANNLDISLAYNNPSENTTYVSSAWQGVASLRLSSSVSGANNYAYIPYDITVSPSTAYTLSAYLNIQNQIFNGYVRLRIIEKNANGDVVKDTLGTNYSAITTGYTRATLTVTTTTDTKFVELRLVNSGVGIVYFDGVQFEKNSSATAFQVGSFLESPFSNWLSFKCLAKPTCTVTYPTNDFDTVVSEIPTFSHSLEDSTQKSYQYKVYKETNLLTKDQATVDNFVVSTTSTGFHAVNLNNTDLSKDTTVLWNGYPSVKTVTKGTQSYEGLGCYIPFSSYAPNETYTLSVYLKGSGNFRMFMWGWNPESLWTTPVTTFTLTNTWTRYSVTYTMPSDLQPNRYALYGMRIDVNGVNQATTFWASGFQIEKGNVATEFVVPETKTNLVWDSGILTDSNNLIVMPKALLQDHSVYSLNISVVDENGLTSNENRRFATDFTSTSNAINFDVVADSDNSKMNLSWKNIDTKPAKYIGSGQRYKSSGKFTNGIEISEAGEKLYWELDMPETFTLANWFKSNLNPTKTSASGTFTRNSSAYTRDYTLIGATNTPRYENSFFGNLLTDNQASIETSTSNFSTLANTTMTRVNETTAGTGTYCLLINHLTSGTSFGVNTTVNLPLLTTDYTFSVYGKLKSGTSTIYARIEWKDNNNTVLSSVNSSNTTLDNTWKRLTVTGTAPANATKATLCIYTSGSYTYTTSDAWYIDSLQFEFGTTAKAYVTPSSGRSILIEEATTNLFDATKNTSDVENIAGTDTTSYRLDATTNASYEDLQSSGALATMYDVPDPTKPYTITFQAKWNTRLTYDFRCYDATGTTFLGYASITKTIDPAPDPNNYQFYEIKVNSFPAGTAKCEFFRWFYTDTDNTGIANLKFIQLEQKPFSTTYCPPASPRTWETLSVPATVLNLSQGTIEFWLYVNDKIKDILNNNRYVFSTCASPSGNPYPNTIALRRTPSNTWDFWLVDTNGSTTTLACSDTLSIGWHHFACRWSPLEASIFIDGVKKNTITNPKLPTVYASNFYLGSWNGSSMYGNIMLDDFRISTIPRSDADITNNYKTKKTVDMYTTCYLDFNNLITYEYMPKQTGKILLKYLYKDKNNWLKFGYDFMTGCFYVEKMVNGTIRLIGSPASALVIGQPIFYALKQNTNGITVYTGVNGTLTKWGD